MNDFKKPRELPELRAEIDRVDQALLALVNERGALAQEVGERKQLTDAPIYRPEREAQIQQWLATNNPGPLSVPALQAVWTELISGCRELERPLRIAYLGPAGTYSEQAALEQFGSRIERLPQQSIDDVFRAVETKVADFGVAPVENSTEGSIGRTLDLLLDSPLQISGERSLVINHQLLTQSGSMQGVTKICAHSQALAQCQHTLNRWYPGVERLAVSSNAEGARLAANDPCIAGVASVAAAKEFGLQVARAGVQDDIHNRTRFVFVGHYLTGVGGQDITSMIISVPNQAGAVHHLIAPLAEFGVSMTRFESRPARSSAWEYFFHIDILGHQNDPMVQRAIAALRANAEYFKITGSYPRHVLAT